MSIHIVKNKNTISHLFEGWEETMIWSCLQDCMGIAYSDDLEKPTCAQISIGDLIFFAGEPNDDLIYNKPENLKSSFAILVPQSSDWETSIERCLGEKVNRHIRYATKKERDVFDATKLQGYISSLPIGYELKFIDRVLYEEILTLDWASDLCSNYMNYEEYKSLGLGVVILKNGKIVSGASSYTSFRSGIEIQIDTLKDERGKGLALVCGAKIILECLQRNLYPSWDAYDKVSLALAEKLGYHFDKEYPVYEFNGF